MEEDRSRDVLGWTAEPRDPYGFFHIVSGPTAVPKELSGVFTSVSEVEKAIKQYNSNMKALKKRPEKTEKKLFTKEIQEEAA